MLKVLILFFTFNLIFFSETALAELTLQQVDLLIEQAKTDPNAVKQIRSFADNGDARGENTLGLIYYQGIGVTQNYSEAFIWISKAAEHGYASALYNLGGMYWEGKGVNQDFSKAINLWNKAAEQGSAIAQSSLGNIYFEGNHVSKDNFQAISWWNKAAEQGFAEAQHNLAAMYIEGKGVFQDDSQAIKWLRKAAEQNFVQSQLSLGAYYQNGKSVKKSFIAAYALYNCAANNDKMNASFYIARITERMNSEDIKAAKKLSDEMMQKGNFLAALDKYIANQTE